MASNIGDLPLYPVRSGKRDWVALQMTALIGAAGAVSTQAGDTRFLSLTKGAGAGEYVLQLPNLTATTILNDTNLLVTPVSAALTVVGYAITGLDATLSTLTFKTVNGAGAATNPADGDLLMISLFTKASQVGT